MMKCVVCDDVIKRQFGENRKVFYCSINCRNIYYRRRDARRDILDDLKKDNFYKKIQHYKVSTILKAGFKVLIFDKREEQYLSTNA
jgi:hypothetical protein